MKGQENDSKIFCFISKESVLKSYLFLFHFQFKFLKPAKWYILLMNEITQNHEKIQLFFRSCIFKGVCII